MMSAIVSYFAKLADRHAWLRTKEFILYVGMGVPILPGVIAALIAPDDVLTNFDALRAMTNGMSALIPAINKYTSASKFPELTRLTLTLFWVMGILQALFLYLTQAVARYRRVQKAIPHARPSFSIKAILAGLIGLPVIGWMVIVGPSPEQFLMSSYLQAMGQFRVGLAYYGAIFFSFGILLFSGSGAVVVLWILGRYEALKERR